MIKKYQTILFFSVLILGALYIYSHLLITSGMVKERAGKECVSASAISNWENTLNIAKAICVDAQNDHVTDVKKACSVQIDNLNKEVKYWKDSYFWLKKQSETEIIIKE